jgi:hypothetical protein
MPGRLTPEPISHSFSGVSGEFNNGQLYVKSGQKTIKVISFGNLKEKDQENVIKSAKVIARLFLEYQATAARSEDVGAKLKRGDTLSAKSLTRKEAILIDHAGREEIHLACNKIMREILDLVHGVSTSPSDMETLASPQKASHASRLEEFRIAQKEDPKPQRMLPAPREPEAFYEGASPARPMEPPSTTIVPAASLLESPLQTIKPPQKDSDTSSRLFLGGIPPQVMVQEPPELAKEASITEEAKGDLEPATLTPPIPALDVPQVSSDTPSDPSPREPPTQELVQEPPTQFHGPSLADIAKNLPTHPEPTTVPLMPTFEASPVGTVERPASSLSKRVSEFQGQARDVLQNLMTRATGEIQQAKATSPSPFILPAEISVLQPEPKAKLGQGSTLTGEVPNHPERAGSRPAEKPPQQSISRRFVPLSILPAQQSQSSSRKETTLTREIPNHSTQAAVGNTTDRVFQETKAKSFQEDASSLTGAISKAWENSPSTLSNLFFPGSQIATVQANSLREGLKANLAGKREFLSVKGRKIDTMYFKVEDAALRNSFAARGLQAQYSGRRPTVILFDRNAGAYEMQGRLIEYYLSNGFNVMAFNYSGYGESEGQRCQRHCDQDAEEVYKKVLSLGAPEEKVVLHGMSIGGGVASNLAEKHPKSTVILDRSFGKVQDIIPNFLEGMFPPSVISTLQGISPTVCNYNNFKALKDVKRVYVGIGLYDAEMAGENREKLQQFCSGSQDRRSFCVFPSQHGDDNIDMFGGWFMPQLKQELGLSSRWTGWDPNWSVRFPGPW